MATICQSFLLLLALLLTTVQAYQPCRNERDRSSNKFTVICSRSNNLTKFPYFFPNTEVFILTGSKKEPYEFDWFESFKLLPASLREIRISYTNLNLISSWMFKSLTSLTKLDLSNNQIRDIDLKALQGLSGLKYLNLSGNRIDELPSYQFQNLVGLEFLDLSNNQLGIVRQKSLVGLKSLRELRLDGNKMSALLSNSINLPMENLSMLNISNNDLDQWEPYFFSKLSKLEVLDLSHNALFSVNEYSFQHLTALKRLYLDSNHMRRIEEDTFYNLTLLELDLSNNNLVTIPSSAFWELRCETLRMNRNPILNITDLSRALRNMSSVDNLDMSMSAIKDHDLQFEPFKGLEHLLVRLNLSYNLLTQLPKLPKFARIKELDFSNNQITKISKTPDFDVVAYSAKLASRQAHLYLQRNRFYCDSKCDIELLNEFEQFNYKCKHVSDYYCLRCGQEGELRDRKIMDVAESLKNSGEDCRPAIGYVLALPKSNFVYYLIILAVVLFIFLALLFVFRKKVFKSVYRTGELKSNEAERGSLKGEKISLASRPSSRN